jgi:LPS export ABC transporter protein LptC
MSTHTTAWTITLFAVAIGSWLLARSNKSDTPVTATENPAYRGYYLTDARILGTDADGSRLYEIIAKKAEQQSDERIEFSDVHIEYSPDSEVPWSIDARTATLRPDRETVHLQGDVRAVSAEGFSGENTELRTESLDFDPEQFVASTEERIRIQIGDRTLTGIGMVASLREDRLEIKSNVRGRFIP